LCNTPRPALVTHPILRYTEAAQKGGLPLK
jgi:hypothetical protein